jgi:hypothetical protein
MRSIPRPTVVALGLGLAMILAACGGSAGGDRVASLSGAGATSTTGPTDAAAKDPQQRALDFARCMRAHGVDMPDPEVDDQGRIKMRIGGGKAGERTDPKKLEAAQTACGSLIGGGDGDRQIVPAERDAMVAFAKCMREHGIDMPDPTGDGLTVRRDKDGGGPDPDSEEFKAAEQACDHFLGNLRAGKGSGGQP